MRGNPSGATLTDAYGKRNSEQDERDQEQEDERTYEFQTRWWFAATGFPLIAGTFGPMASAFSILALVANWREELGGDASHTGAGIPDPRWLIAINATQLAIAIIGNMFLLLNMAQTVRFSIAQPIIFGGWWISALTLTSLCATASGPLKLSDPKTQEFSQAFYYAIISAVLYLLVAILMTIAIIGALAGKYEKNFQLTMSQRTLMLPTISLLVYLEISALIFSHIEGWSFLDAVYFSNVTLLTIGLGDITPETHLGRSLFIPYAVGGIIIIGLVIGSIRNMILETGGDKIGARIVEKERERKLKHLSEHGHKESTEVDYRHRKDEFDIMRKIQENANRRKRWTALFFSGSVWFILWFAGAAVFQAAERDEEWSYFEAVYFSYTCLLTIGYGDFYPTSASGKPFFVVWSLLAIPSLTILISNMSDTVVKSVNDSTIWIGQITILPGEGGFKHALIYPIVKLTKGKVFGDDFRATAPGLLGEARRPRVGHNQSSRNHFRKHDPESLADQHNGQRRPRNVQNAKDVEASSSRGLPKTKSELHVVLIDEIANVTRDLGGDQPKKYSFEEWIWYLTLMGEVDGHPRHQNLTRTDAPYEKRGIEDRRPWSWVDVDSPLMAPEEEPEWILKRLIRRLQREMRSNPNDSFDGLQL